MADRALDVCQFEYRGDLHAIAPQASERKSLTFTVIEGEAAIDGLIARRDALLG